MPAEYINKVFPLAGEKCGVKQMERTSSERWSTVTEELKPCPFCGGEAADGYAVHDYNCYGVFCTVCGASIEAVPPIEDTREGVIAAWNRRDGKV